MEDTVIYLTGKVFISVNISFASYKARNAQVTFAVNMQIKIKVERNKNIDI